MDNRQWIATTATGGLIASAFLYFPFIGGIYALLIACVLQGIYIGWQHVLAPQFRMGILSFSTGAFVGMPIMGLLLSRTGPGNLWGMMAMFGISVGVISMVATRLIRNWRSKSN
jgi:hypothetical protein